MRHVVKVADKEQRLLRLLGAADKDRQALLVIAAVDPLEALRVIIHLVERRMGQIQMVQGFHIILHLLVNRILGQIPLQGSVLVPLVYLSEVLPHEEQLLARMSRHKAISGPQVLSLFLQGVPRHLADHGTFSVNHLVMGEHQYKVLAVGVEHGEGQLPVIVLAEIGVAAHIAGKVVHPAHIPLKVESQAAVLGLARHLGPGRGLLGDQHRPVLSPMEYGA